MHLRRHTNAQHLRLLAFRKLVKERLDIKALSIPGRRFAVLIVRCGVLSGLHCCTKRVVITLVGSAISSKSRVVVAVVVVVIHYSESPRYSSSVSRVISTCAVSSN